MKKLIFLFLFMFSFSAFSQWTSNLNTDKKYFGSTVLTTKEKSGNGIYTNNNYDVKFYGLDIALERTSTYVSGNVTINSIVTTSVLDTFIFELYSGLIIDSVKINNVLKTSIHTTDIAKVPISPALTIGTSFSAIIYYHGNPPSGGFFSGISHGYSPTWFNEVVWTLSEPFNAYQWWPCKQDLTDKADSSWVFVTTNSTNKVGSNGLLTAEVTVPGGKKCYEWKSNHPIDYYLISVSVAKYVDYTIYAHPLGTSDSVMVQNYVYDNSLCLPYFQSEIDYTTNFIELYSELYGLYPFINEKYGHCMAPLGGGMEHQTMTTLGSFNFDLICHELSHQWFGDNVTCATWSDIWVNEGFATYSEYLAYEFLDPTNAQSWLTSNHSSVMSAPDGSVYVPPALTNDENRIFDSRLSYDKGGAIIHNIRFEMQDDSAFFETLKDYQSTYGGDVATGLDFKAVVEAHSSVDFTDFFNQWYFGEGYPTYNIVWNQVADTIVFTATQTVSAPAVTPLFKMLMEYKLSYAGGDTLFRVYQTANSNVFKIHTDRTITGFSVDPNDWVVDGTPTVTIGIEETTNPLFFTLAPSPCSENLTVYLTNANTIKKKYSICDISGRIIETNQFVQNRIDINTSKLSQGIYFLIVTDTENKFIRRFVKQ